MSIINRLQPVETQSKKRKEFYKLLQQVEDKRLALQKTAELNDQINQKLLADYYPLIPKLEAEEARWLTLLEKAYRQFSWKAGEAKKLRHIIMTKAFVLAKNNDAMKSLFEQYSEQTYAEAMEQTLNIDDVINEIIREDIDPDETKGADNDSKTENDPDIEESTPKEHGQKSQKQQFLGNLRGNSENTLKSPLRELYLDLVKALHPDLELEESEKGRKTEILQKVIGAYEANDLLTLLELQIDLPIIDESSLEKLSEDRINTYNSILRKQTKELTDKNLQIIDELSLKLGLSSRPEQLSYPYLIGMVKKNIKAIKQEITAIKSEVEALDRQEFIRFLLRNYTISQSDDMDFF